MNGLAEGFNQARFSKKPVCDCGNRFKFYSREHAFYYECPVCDAHKKTCPAYYSVRVKDCGYCR